MTTTTRNGRLGNQIIRNLAVSLIAEKNDLFVDYYDNEIIKRLGINLFVGTKKYGHKKVLNDDNYFSVYNETNMDYDLDPNNNYFQTKEIIQLLYDYLHTNNVKMSIMTNNPFKERYNANNDLFIHVRLTDVAHFNPGVSYYLNTIEKIHHNDIYLSTDQENHPIIGEICSKYPKIRIIRCDEINTFQFASTCRNIILSHGSFSAIIGYLAYFSNIFYPEYEKNKMWYGDMFSINGWNKQKINNFL
jgi:hypothetical protein